MSKLEEIKSQLKLAYAALDSMHAMLNDLVQPQVLVNQATDGAGPSPGRSPVTPFVSSKFVLSQASLKELTGVKPELVAVVKRAIQLTTQDFTVYDGIRSVKEQQAHVAAGTSKTMKSKHLEGLAVDLVPWVGKPVWEWERIYPIAFAMDQAATELGFANHIRWGGAWDRTLADFGNQLADYKKECALYSQRHPGKDFLDGPHFEWVD